MISTKLFRLLYPDCESYDDFRRVKLLDNIPELVILDMEINIHELAHKCKEWAEKEGYILPSNSYDNKGFCEIKKITPERLLSIPWCPKDFNSETEAVIEACEWILEKEELK